MRAVVTGGAGFIGSNLVDALVARGDEVTVVDNFASGKRQNLNPAATLLEHDIREPFSLDADAIFHLAAQADGVYERGVVAMANAGPDTNGSQFFINYKDGQLAKNYTPFGVVTKGMAIVEVNRDDYRKATESVYPQFKDIIGADLYNEVLKEAGHA